jgi:hypothetical protein
VALGFGTVLVVAALVLAALALCALRGHFSAECPGCKKRGGVKLKDRKWVESKRDRTVYNDCYSCRYCGYTYYVNAEVMND